MIASHIPIRSSTVKAIPPTDISCANFRSYRSPVIGTPTSLIYGQDTELNVIKDCTIAHELVPIVTMSANGMHQHQYHQSTLPEMLDNIPDMSQYDAGESVMLSQLDIFQQQQMQSIATPTSSAPPPTTQVNMLTGVYTLQEEPEDTDENAM